MRLNNTFLKNWLLYVRLSTRLGPAIAFDLLLTFYLVYSLKAFGLMYIQSFLGCWLLKIEAHWGVCILK